MHPALCRRHDVIVTSIPHFAHSLRRMTGRDPQEVHRAATPLELLFDLTFVVAFGVASSQTAHLLAEGHVGPALLGFGFALFAISWAWINFSWFASAYDTDDWLFRVLTMVQMIGVVVLALGLPTLFESLDHGRFLDNTIVVLGYVIMRVALVPLPSATTGIAISAANRTTETGSATPTGTCRMAMTTHPI
jgi:low temperature requirement protein LtrA